MDLKEISINTTDWVDSGRDYWRAFVNAAFNLQVSLAMELFRSIYDMFRRKMTDSYFLETPELPTMKPIIM